MARETAAQRREREAAEAAMRLQERADAYPQRLLNAMSAAVREGFELTNVDPVKRVFTFLDRNEHNEYTVFMDFGAAGQSEWTLEELESGVQDRVWQREEAERLANLRKTALAKLTKEEREALGVTTW